VRAAQYSDREYWDKRYGEATGFFEWYHGYDALREVRDAHLSRSIPILQVWPSSCALGLPVARALCKNAGALRAQAAGPPAARRLAPCCWRWSPVAQDAPLLSLAHTPVRAGGGGHVRAAAGHGAGRLPQHHQRGLLGGGHRAHARDAQGRVRLALRAGRLQARSYLGHRPFRNQKPPISVGFEAAHTQLASKHAQTV